LQTAQPRIRRLHDAQDAHLHGRAWFRRRHGGRLELESRGCRERVGRRLRRDRGQRREERTLHTSTRRLTRSGSMQRKIGRRGLLGGAAVTLALPFMPSLDRPMGGVRLAAAAAAPPKRFLVYFFPNGVYAKDWTPANA